MQTLSSQPVLSAGITAAQLPNGLFNINTTDQSQQPTGGTAVYITNSNITFPAAFKGGILVGSRMTWRLALTKTANGTGAFSFIIYRGTNGSTSDTADVTQSIGTQTAAVDSMFVDISVVVTTVGAANTGAYSWSITPVNKAATATGFGVVTGTTGMFSGTKSSVTINLVSNIFSIGYLAAAGGTLPTVRIVSVVAQAYNIS